MSVLSEEQRQTFEGRGCVQVPGAFSAGLARRFTEEMWLSLAREFGVDREDPSTWRMPPYATKLERIKRHPLQNEVASTRLCGAIDELLGEDRWNVPGQWGGVLVTLPKPGEKKWELPADVWHFDSRLPENVDVLRRVFVFTIFAPLSARGGATLVLEGSHRLLKRFHDGLSDAQRELKHKWHRQMFLRSDPWLVQLSTPNEPEDRVKHFMACDSTVRGVPARVRELTGDPGDAWLCHPLMLHSRSPCVGTAPRFMMAKMISPVHA